ncbi:hypothetical protein [Solibacillus sp. FSL K6-1554]|uniref:hypothetical protein n=1 Tax=Solibacillus sp. FSL K6-1554 TaxID=2921472 RepID=UPI0030F726BB
MEQSFNLQEEKAKMIQRVRELSASLDNDYIAQAIMLFDNSTFNENLRRAILVNTSKEENIESLIKRLNARFDYYVIAFIFWLKMFLEDSHKYTDEELTVVEAVFERFDLTNLDTETVKNRERVIELIKNPSLQDNMRSMIHDELCNFLDPDAPFEDYENLLFNKVMFELLYTKTSELKYEEIIRPKVSSQTMRMDDELYRMNEIVRAFHSNEFVVPNNNDILRTLLTKHISDLRREQPEKLRQIEKAFDSLNKK